MECTKEGCLAEQHMHVSLMYAANIEEYVHVTNFHTTVDSF